ncbi:hypothetical protein [Castellaniella caeni]
MLIYKGVDGLEVGFFQRRVTANAFGGDIQQAELIGTTEDVVQRWTSYSFASVVSNRSHEPSL